ncbi:MAG TPA: ASCH domain-containing protein [Planctomycetaceae bacterium]
MSSSTARKQSLTTATILSIRQPFADFVIFGSKWCENRSWNTTYRGELYIHASTWDGSVSEYRERDQHKVYARSPSDTAIGAILGKVTLLDVLTRNELVQVSRFLDGRPAHVAERLRRVAKFIRWYSDDTWNYAAGPFCYILVNPKPFVAPIPAKGKLRLWTMDVNLAALKFRDWKPGHPYGKERGT